MAARFRIPLWCVLGAALPALAQQDVEAPPPRGLSCAEMEFLDMLEFLGTFTTEDGEWVDPDDLLAAGEAAPDRDGSRDEDDDA